MSYPLTVTRDMTQPPGGWVFTVEQTGFEIRAASAQAMVGKVRSHLQANEIPLPEDFDGWLKDALCRQMNLGHPFCGATPPKRVAGMPVLSRSMASRFLRTVMGVLRERKFVPRVEAERRVAICMACPLATSIGGCFGNCDSAFITVAKLMRKNPIIPEAGKEFCGACGCLISAKCWIDNDTLNQAEGKDKPPYAEGLCWRLE